jgi:hypothetical protein
MVFRRFAVVAASLGAAGPALLSARPAAAQEDVAIAEPPPGEALPAREVTHFNGPVLVTAAVLGGGPYIMSAGVAIESSHPGDGYLAIPVAGPWIDLGVRAPCEVASNCTTESSNRALLVASGLAQAAGALTAVAAFVFPKTTRLVTLSKNGSGPSVAVAPAAIGRQGYGLSAAGLF